LFAWSRARWERADARRSFAGERSPNVVELVQVCVVQSKREVEREGEENNNSGGVIGDKEMRR
jgi:hypothetical protein